MKVVNYSKIIHKERTDKTMAELSHLDQLEAEAIYIIREVAAECEKPVMLLFYRKGQLRYAPSGDEGILPGETTISIFTC